MASRDEIDRIRSTVNILDVVAPYVALKRAGSVWKGLCPFHSERTPSFQVSPDKGFWYCFGQCGMGGDAFRFLEKIENLNFAEALERLAKMAGITLTNTRESTAELSQRDKLYRALEAAANFYQETLARSPDAKKYLLDRGVAQESQSLFRLGYAGDSFDGLAAYLRRQKIDISDAAEAGILTQGDPQYGNGPYDKLRGRIICPIMDVHDRPIAFGGRLMVDVKERPKYLNTAETPLFSKGKTFFAMSRARKPMADLGFATVVEGYFDVISAHQAGFGNVVATLGTSLTVEHAEMLARQVKRVLLAFDADAAGFKAAQRANEIFEARGFEVQVLDMPKGEDPDSLLRVGRSEEFRAAIDNAAPIVEFQLRALLEHYQSKRDLSERDKAGVFRRNIIPLLRSTRSVIERERYIRICAPLHPFYDQGSAQAEDQIRQELNGTLPVRHERQQNPRASWNDGNGRGSWRKDRNRHPFASPPGAPHAPRSGIQAAEENLLRALISEDQSISKIITESAAVQELFLSPECRELARRMLLGDPVSVLMEIATRSDSDIAAGTDFELHRLGARLLTNTSASMAEDHSDEVAPLSEAVIEDSILRLRKEQNAHRERLLRSRAEQGDTAAAQELMQLIRKLHG